ncbi:hypothetical protein K523DRAFT_252709 [Schizophyllum commune Tattone D]|nr:hypothetical protein K523DRAFT_252709 [Schizophyllum commune Tattone D]
MPSSVCHVYLLCGHVVNMIRCTSRTCKFSPNHPSTCMPPRCTLTCWQYRQFPEQYSPNISSYCPSCLGRRHQ